MLDKLTKEQEAKFPEYVKKWAEIGNSLVAPDFYTQDVVDRIKDCVVAMYAAAKYKISRDKIIMATSPIMGSFVCSALVLGKTGRPKKEAKCKLPNMEKVQEYVNGFSNPKEIIKNASKFTSVIYWNSLSSGFFSQVDFFQNETSLGENELKKFEDILEKVKGIIIPATFCMYITKDFCIVCQKPVYMDLDTSGDYPIAKSGAIKWADGTEIKY